MDYLIRAVPLVTAAALVFILFDLTSRAKLQPRHLLIVKDLTLWLSGLVLSFMTAMLLVAAAWGMDTRIPWGLGIYPYVIPALSLPAFLLLTFTSVRVLSRLLWVLTLVSALAWYFSDIAERAVSGLKPVTDTMERLGMFFNAFTLVLIMASTLVQVAAICDRKRSEAGIQ